MVRPSGGWNRRERCATLGFAFHTLEARVPDRVGQRRLGRIFLPLAHAGQFVFAYAAFTAVPVGVRTPLR
jgi:hypothetical protein